MNWWKNAIFYEIYVPKFADSNNDGIGDFVGITSKLDYLNDLGINGIWLTPFYESPKIDNGYDISDYYKIDKDYGSMIDFENFIEKAKQLNIKVIIDIVLNHTSNLHEWFLESKTNTLNQKRQFYIWKDKPNNWNSFFAGSAWEFDETTKQYYYHAFSKEQVDLNWTNIKVQDEMFKVMEFWLDKGIDGFRFDVINFLKSDDDFTNNPVDENKSQIHLHDQNKPNTILIINKIRNFINKFENKFTVGEIGSENINIIKSYAHKDLLHTTFNFNLGSLKTFDINKFFIELNNLNIFYKENETYPTLFFSSHDMKRFYERFNFNKKQSKLIAVLMLTFRGIPFIYYGDEIFLENVTPNCISQINDIQGILEYENALEKGKSPNEAFSIALERSRDGSRGLIPWDNFTNLNTDFYNFYKIIIKIRKTYKALSHGNIEDLNLTNNIISYTRNYKDEKILVYLNFGAEKHEINISKKDVIFGNQLGILDCYESLILKEV